MIHAYADVNPDLLWDIVTGDLPHVIGAIESTIENDPS
jgi:uncharacterized protein with HEPN domain